MCVAVCDDGLCQVMCSVSTPWMSSYLCSSVWPIQQISSVIVLEVF